MPGVRVGIRHDSENLSTVEIHNEINMFLFILKELLHDTDIASWNTQQF